MGNPSVCLQTVGALSVRDRAKSIYGRRIRDRDVGCRTEAISENTLRSQGRYQMPNIVETAVGAGSFKTLVQAVQAAGLAETLSSPGPFTVFAPTDDAFAKLPAGTIDSLLKDTPKLKDVLTYHVLSGKVMSADAAKLTSAPTVQGQTISIDSQDGVKINDASVVQADIEADNGVIHVIDQVLLPK
jgi:uncharacterized surface protein with fasciclin (FAS1) repeats